MNRRDLYTFFALEVFAVIWAGAVFSLISARLVAAGLAGGYFVLSGLFMLARAWRWPDKWSSAGFYPLLVHVWVISIPMVITRFLHADQPFENVNILGLSGPVFHQLSSGVFSCLMAGTLVDLIRLKLRRNSAA